MRVYNDINEVHLTKPVVTLGIFDGIHRGHQHLIGEVKREAGIAGRDTLLITYWPHPRHILKSAGEDFRMLTTLDEKLWLFEKMEVDHCLVIPFTPDFAAITADEFIQTYLSGPHLPEMVIVGDDHRYGRGGEGNLEHLTKASRRYHFQIRHLNSHLDNDLRISSSMIRACLQEGDLTSANRLLGYPFLLIGEVIPGNRLGSTIGFPTANISCCGPGKQVPSDGVYAVRVDWQGCCYDGMLNIGYRPTLGDAERKTIEVHIFDLEEDLYGDNLRIQFIQRLRDEMKFDGLDPLKAQLLLDREKAKEVLTTIRTHGISYLCD